MKALKLFLSGSVEKKVPSSDTSNSWKYYHENILKSTLHFPIEIFNPAKINIDENNSRFRFETDIKMLLKSDIMIVDARKKRGIGVGSEMMLAKINKIFICVIAPENSHYRKFINEEKEWTHPFIFELADKIFNDINELVYYLNDLYDKNRLPYSEIIDSDDIFNKLMSFDGGYDEGYSSVQEFWGDKAAELVSFSAELLKKSKIPEQVSCIDLGCGTGKNSIYLYKQGFQVEALDVSYYGISEAIQKCSGVKWSICDIRKIITQANKYDLVIMTGSLHCLATKAEVKNVIEKMKEATKVNGYHVLSSFNSTKQDLSGHQSNFHPILLSHEEYLSMYSDWNIIYESNNVQDDIHPNNYIKHQHSITRILAQKIK